MKYALFTIVLTCFLTGCSNEPEGGWAPVPVPHDHDRDVIPFDPDTPIDTFVDSEEKEVTPLPDKVSLKCKQLPDDEWDNPVSEVFLVTDETEISIRKCQACETIPKEDFDSYEIPESAIDACGGWWAGGGEYFYAIIEDEELVVYYGWQDEGQVEEDDFGFHWEPIHTWE